MGERCGPGEELVASQSLHSVSLASYEKGLTPPDQGGEGVAMRKQRLSLKFVKMGPCHKTKNLVLIFF